MTCAHPSCQFDAHHTLANGERVCTAHLHTTSGADNTPVPSRSERLNEAYRAEMYRREWKRTRLEKAYELGRKHRRMVARWFGRFV